MVDGEASRKTYRYLRIGMIGAVVLLGASVLIEHQKAPDGCWQTAISAYYYTPVRAVFVGALMAIGLTLIVIKGSTWLEDAFLNVAGMLAPVVALVPMSNPGRCWSIAPNPLPIGSDGRFQPWVQANIDNNIEALLYAGFAGLAAAAVIAIIAYGVGKKRGEPKALADFWNESNRGTFAGLLLALFLIVGAAVLFAVWDGFERNAHGLAAYTMFGMLALAAIANARDSRDAARHRYSRLYVGIAAGMVVAVVPLFSKWDHRLLAVEVAEILLFAAFWIVQTRELWNETTRSDQPTPEVAAPGRLAASTSGR